MIKKILGSFIFLIGLCGMVVLLSAVFDPKTDIYDVANVTKCIENLYMEEDNTIDVLFLGDSECYATFNPIQMWRKGGITSFVAATSNQRLCDTKALFLEAQKTQQPKIVVIESDCFFRYPGYKIPGDKVMDIISRKASIFKYHNSWKKLCEHGYIPKADNYKKPDYGENEKIYAMLRGYVYRDDIVAYKDGEWMKKTNEKEYISKQATQYIKEICEVAKENDCRVVIVSAPSPRNHTYERHNACLELANSCEIPYIDFNLLIDEMKFDVLVDFKDGGDHVNITGSNKVTDYLLEYIKNENLTVDHKGDPNYYMWTDMPDDVYRRYLGMETED